MEKQLTPEEAAGILNAEEAPPFVKQARQVGLQKSAPNADVSGCPAFVKAAFETDRSFRKAGQPTERVTRADVEQMAAEGIREAFAAVFGR